MQTITSALGKIPVIFITATPDDCRPCDPLDVILQKPISSSRLIETFRRLAPS